MKEKKIAVFEFLCKALQDSGFLKMTGRDKNQMTAYIRTSHLQEMAAQLAEDCCPDGRFDSRVVVAAVRKYVPVLSEEPEGGWLAYCYCYVLERMFPGTGAAWKGWDGEGVAHAAGRTDPYRSGRQLLMQILRGLYQYENSVLPFDPTRMIMLLGEEEVLAQGYTREYLHMRKLAADYYVYEFMRIGVDISPFNTLGHIGGVHYVAMYAARQLCQFAVPVDLALISGAAACHDIGKYGCKKNEEKRVPYLHYYYTGMCCRRMGLSSIGHIAANHSVWDLELENLSVESLLLIYADFRVKSSRDKEGNEIVHFYSLAEAFDVILGKLDNVDEAKKHRYQKVYAKLADFEKFMVEQGVTVELPQNLSQEWEAQPQQARREKVLMEGEEIVDQLKYAAIDHNIRLMSIFRDESDFGNLIEAARSERLWKNVRTYIGIFEEYSTYMTEHQKMMILKFLYELLSHKEGDIRMQAAVLMGRIVAKFNDTYTKELPQGVSLPDKAITNYSLFSQYVEMIIYPELRFTEQHKLWIGYCLSSFICAVLAGCRPADRTIYMTAMRKYYETSNYPPERYIILLKVLVDVDRDCITADVMETAAIFIREARQSAQNDLCVAALNAARHLFPQYTQEQYYRDLLQIMKLPEDRRSFAEKEGNLFLIDLKQGTHWIIKVANIELMLRYVDDPCDVGGVMHLGMHLTNLLKVSETIFVRRAAGESLLTISSNMTYSQRNELAVELFNGLEIGDPQISKYVPEFLGRMILKLPPQELDEFVSTIEAQILTVNIPLASAMVHTVGVILEKFAEFTAEFHDAPEINELRQRRLLYIMIKAYAHYDKELSRDAFRDIGKFIFHSPIMSMEQKNFLFVHCYKKMMVLLDENIEGTLDFYSNAAVLNHIYRYIGLHEFDGMPFAFATGRRACFYPGTFDPFSLGHKAVAKKIRDLGFDIYLALDEFSWSKHTQPRLMRRKIMNMSVADEEDMYPFPDDIPVNIANPSDIRRLKQIFSDKELYIAVGTDVIENASAYKIKPSADSIHTVNHIAFARETRENEAVEHTDVSHGIQADVIYLTLDKFYEDISSTKIRENIDLNRDISNLIDAVAQNFIYDNNLYLREPAYKHVLEAREIGIGAFKPRGAESLWPVCGKLWDTGYDTDILDRYVEKDYVWTLYIDDASQDKAMIAYAAVHRVGTLHLLKEFGDSRIAAHIRSAAAGRIACIGFLYADDKSGIANVSQIIITEILTELIARDFSYAVYHPVDEAGYDENTIAALERQGFVNIAPPGAQRPLYAVDMKSPIVIFRDVETTIKNPFNKNPRVRRAIYEAHNNLLSALNRIYPGKLLLSFNMSAVHNKIIRKVADINGVSIIEDKNKRRGPYMSVPFGKALSDVLVPNTVTKTLHIDKYFNRSVKGFTIAETHHYSSVSNQVKTIKSFNRPVILIDDLLHKGHRMRMLTPYLMKNDIDIKRVLVGVMTGQAMDMMAEKNIQAESAYFLPTLEVWLNERDCYPFIGGDSIDNAHNYSGYDSNPSINLVLPYVKPAFIGKGNARADFLYSLTCLKNAALIMHTLQDVYQETYEKRLTLKRLGEVIMYPRVPDIDVGVRFDENMDPTRFIENDIERLVRLRWGETDNGTGETVKQ
ncbi:phosphohydrolase [Megasphaera cerevisiae DSM 20462]|uniref:nicotinate-nucleotide adenylyltransferase n=1 Tax=Megasphaera cerevisiae DSM 20462 TaxID=1122219 RepID=A0A0J6WSH2_9FIRM|nr:phosphohydrolase [Megasphaera cerevisiae]KMO86460.1 phosphohydrolase [Megasphaera cerevisiae DSM 20462]OKY53387.1 phosphohydrolase [Megasphaera cerevisiae]SJZ94843.1 Nicotinic acid mononucleotide adenylyltransferase [Megasphaera cerevisiae DSM 20462]